MRVVVRRLPRDLYVAAVARAGSILCNTVAVTALVLDFHERGIGAWAVAALLAAGAVPIVLLAPLVGLVVDRFDSRLLMVTSSMWQAVVCVVLAFVGQPQVVLPLVVLNACGTALVNPLFLALTTVMVPSSQLAVANSVQQGAVTIAMMAGPPIGGLLTGLTGGAKVPLLFNAAVFVLITVASLLIGIRRRPVPGEHRPNARQGIAMLFTDRVLAAIVTLAVLLTSVVHVIYVAQVFLVRDTFQASSLAYGLLQTMQMTGLLVGIVLASRLNTGRRIVLGAPIAAAFMAAALLAIGLSRSLPATFVLYLVAGMCMSMVSVSVATLLLLRTAENVVGRVTASFTAIHRAASLVAYGVGGVLVGLLRPEVVFQLAGAAALAIVLVLVPATRRAWALC